MDSIHQYTVIAIKLSQSYVSVSGLCRFSASINHTSRQAFVIFLGHNSGPKCSALGGCVIKKAIPSLHTAEPSQLHKAADKALKQTWRKLLNVLHTFARSSYVFMH